MILEWRFDKMINQLFVITADRINEQSTSFLKVS